MRYTLTRGVRRYAIVARGAEGDYEPIVFPEARAAEFFLRGFIDQPQDLCALRRHFLALPEPRETRLLDDNDVLATLGRAIALGDLLVIDLTPLGPSGRLRPVDPRPIPPPVPPPPEPEKAWFEVRVVDDATSQPIPGVKLEITLPNGKAQPNSTRADGRVRLEEIDPGSCKVKGVFDPDAARIERSVDFVAISPTPVEPAPPNAPPPNLSSATLAEIEAHKVQTGETIDSLARGANLTWQQLSLFNWGTSVPEQINEHLRDEVGCTKKTADGYNYVFTSDDDPGIVFIPRVWEQSGLATEVEHVVRVRKVSVQRELFIFSM